MTPVVAAVLIALGYTGCGGADNSNTSAEDPAERLTDAAARTLAEPSMAFRMDINVAGVAATTGNGVEGRADFRTGSGEVAARYDGNEVRARIDGDQFWISGDDPDLVAAMPRGKEWVRGTFADLGDSDVISPLQVPALLYLIGGADDVRAEAQGDITRYRFDIDVARATSSAPASRREEVGELLTSTDDRLVTRGQATVDRDRHILSLRAEGVITGGTDAPSIAVTWEARFGDFGVDVTVTPPENTKVVDLTDAPQLQTQFFGINDSAPLCAAGDGC